MSAKKARLKTQKRTNATQRPATLPEKAAVLPGEFERAGLKPAGISGYFQPVKFKSREIVEEESSLALVQNRTAEPLTLGEDATISMRV